MDKNAIKKYAVWARNELIARVSQKAQQYGITAEGYGDKNADSVNGVLLSATEKKQRQALIAKIDAEGFEQVMEEVAYTWFNRFTALRFMEVNNYLPSHTRVFTNEANEFRPQILTDAISIELDGLDMEMVYELKDANKDEELYKYLLVVQCNALNEVLPEMFKKIEDFSGLLLPDYLLRSGSVIEQMISLIPESDWLDQVEVLGWLYQFYINEPKDVLINAKKQYKSADVPFVTQIFTSDWIVQYMVQNSLGRLWLEASGQNETQYQWDYYLNSENVENSAYKKINLEELKVIDPCMGSGHILAYIFDVLMQIYENQGYSQREAAELILEKNIYGTDISERAYQLAYFSVMMKARKYSRNILKKQIRPNLYVLNNVSIPLDIVDFIADGDVELKRLLEQINCELEDLSENGSLIETSDGCYDKLLMRCKQISEAYYDDLVSQSYQMAVTNDVIKTIKIAQLLNVKYESVITNPPYIGNKFLPAKLKKYIEKNYADYKSDVFAAFVDRIITMCKKDGHIGLLTPYVWMFITTYSKYRERILSSTTITSLTQLEYNAFEAACVPVCTYTLKKGVDSTYKGEYVKLSDFRGPDVQGIKVREAALDKSCGYRYSINQERYKSIPGSPIAYWVSDKFVEAFQFGEKLYDIAPTKKGMFTGDNDYFLRLWYEVPYLKFNGDFRPYNKGGGYHKWYGNQEYVVKWHNDGKEIISSKGAGNINVSDYFKPCVTWSLITSGKISFRIIDDNWFVMGDAGPTCYADDKWRYYLLAVLNSKPLELVAEIINPTINFSSGTVGVFPIIRDESQYEILTELAIQNVLLCKNDWNSYETSWGFSSLDILDTGKASVEEAIKTVIENKEVARNKLRENEEAINEIVIAMYGLEEELSPIVHDEDVSIVIPTEEEKVKQLISYAVGCMFGRYDINAGGVVNLVGNSDFVDQDNIIPISSDEYFSDDIVTKFVDFIKMAFGASTLEANLAYISSVLNYKGSSREILRQYFINDFYADHCNTYTSRGAGKRPIYWLFDSGKKNGFKCLIYMHRYQPDTIARIRTDYVHEQQSRYRTAIADLEQRINGASTSERVKLNKQLKTIQDQAEELRKYEEKIHHLADQMIAIDFDDGVKENYPKFQDVLAKIK